MIHQVIDPLSLTLYVDIYLDTYTHRVWKRNKEYFSIVIKEEKNSDFKPVKLSLKIDLVSHPTCAETLVKIHTHTKKVIQDTRGIFFEKKKKKKKQN